MKTVFINNLYKPYAVAEEVVQKRAREAVGRGEEAVVITWGPWQGWGSWKPRKGIEDDVLIYRFWVPNIFSYRNLSKHNMFWRLLWHKIDLFNFWSGRIIKNIIKEEKPDLLETHNLMGIGYQLGIKNKESGVKWKHYLHDVQLVEPSGVLAWDHMKENILQKIYSSIMKRKFRNVNFVISPTEFLKHFYEERDFFKYAEIQVQNSLQPSAFSLQKQKEIGDRPKFLFVGSLVKHKGLHVLMEAWENIKDKGQELHIVGSGVMKEEINTWAKTQENVSVYGRLENEKLESVYRESDILIFPSVCIENNPTVIHEAVHYGLGIIAADTGGVREVLLDGDNSWLYIPDDVEELIKKIRRFV